VKGLVPVGEGLVASVHQDGEPLCLTARRAGASGAAAVSRLILAPLHGKRPMGVIAIENRSLKEEETEEVDEKGDKKKKKAKPEKVKVSLDAFIGDKPQPQRREREDREFRGGDREFRGGRGTQRVSSHRIALSV
jgi:hypothetical protein